MGCVEADPCQVAGGCEPDTVCLLCVPDSLHQPCLISNWLGDRKRNRENLPSDIAFSDRSPGRCVPCLFHAVRQPASENRTHGGGAVIIFACCNVPSGSVKVDLHHTRQLCFTQSSCHPDEICAHAALPVVALRVCRVITQCHHWTAA